MQQREKRGRGSNQKINQFFSLTLTYSLREEATFLQNLAIHRFTHKQQAKSQGYDAKLN